MQAFILVLMCVITTDDFIVSALNLPPITRFIPEAMSVFLIAYVIFAGTRNSFRLVAPKYWVACGAFVIVMLCGIINDPAGSGPMLSGARFYLRAVPMFFLPAVLPMTETQIMRQLKLLGLIALVQLPLAVYQRWVILSMGRFSGDGVQGTLLDSGILSMFQISAVLVLTGFLLQGRIGKLWYGILFFLLLIPTAINETKVTIFMLPIGLMVAVITGSEPQKRMRYLAMSLAALVVFGAAYVPIYNKMEENDPYKNERDIANYFNSEKAMTRYMTSGVGGVGTKLAPRRGDAIVVPLQFLAKDPVTLAFGLGLGSVSPSKSGKNFEGNYFPLFQKFMITSFTYFVLEVGIFGVALIAYLFWLVFFDTLWVAHNDEGLFGALASGWTGVVALFFMGLVYNSFHDFTSVTYLYAYLSGVLCARRVALARAS